MPHTTTMSHMLLTVILWIGGWKETYIEEPWRETHPRGHKDKGKKKKSSTPILPGLWIQVYCSLSIFSLSRLPNGHYQITWDEGMGYGIRLLLAIGLTSAQFLFFLLLLVVKCRPFARVLSMAKEQARRRNSI